MIDDEDLDPVDPPIGASIRRVLAQSPWWSRGPLVPSLACGWLTYYVLSRRAGTNGWTAALVVLAGVVAAGWLGIVCIASRTPNRVLRHSAHYVGVTMLGIAVCATAGALLEMIVVLFR